MSPEMEITARRENTHLTVRLLVSCSGSGTSKLLGFVPPGVSDQQGAVVLDEDVLDLLLALLIHVLLVVGDQGLGERLSDGVDLGHVTASLHADADVDVSKSKKEIITFTLCVLTISTCPGQEEARAQGA